MALIDLPDVGDPHWGGPLNAAIQTLANIIETGRLSPGALEALPQPVVPQPDTPVGLRIVNRTSYFGDGRTLRQRVTVDWSPVTNIPIGQYEVRYVRGTETASRSYYSDDTTAVLDLDGSPHALAVRAQGIEGKYGGFGPSLAIPAAIAPVPLERPSNPTGYSGGGNIFVHWDGKLASGDPGPALKSVFVEMLVAGSWIRVGQALSSAGEALISGLEQGPHSFRLRAEDWSLTPSPPSTVVVIEITNIVAAEITDAINAVAELAADAVASSAQALADAAAATVKAEGVQALADEASLQAAISAGIVGNKADVLIQPTQPGAEMEEPTTLWIDTSNEDNTPKRWDGIAWVPVTDKKALEAADAAVAAQLAAEAAEARAEAAEAAALAAVAAASAAESTANGKVTISAVAPVTADGADKPVGGVWWRRDAAGKLIAQWEWTGTLWKAYTFSEGTIANGAISRLKIRDAAINDAKIADLSAGKISAGTLDAERIGARTITTPKLIVSDYTNLLDNPEADGLVGWGVTGAVTANGGEFAFAPGSSAIVAGNAIPVEEGDEFYVAANVYSTGTVAGTVGGFHAYNQAGANIAAANFTITPTSASVRYSKTFAVPAGVKTVRFRYATALTGGAIHVSRPEFRRRSAGNLIVDGTITATKIAAEAITADHISAGVISVDKLEPNFGDNLNLEANGSINLIVEAQDAMQTGITDAAEAAEDARLKALASGGTAAQASAAAEVARKAAVAAQGTANSANNKVNTVMTHFWVDAEGAHVGKSDSAFQTHVKDDRFEITENGIVQTYWSAGVMNVPSAVISEVVLANHKIENYGSGTVIRAL